ncbi:hypothetical protein [Enterococcus faecium]|nr:hypothetical protein [Enterococcus faecium]
MVEKNFPQAIYGEILAEIESLLHALSNSGEDSKFDEYRQDAINKLDGVKNEVIENIKSLEENSEWDTFTVAFYGETNAGKSTLIESLRILLKEKKKLEEHQIFRDKELELEGLIQKVDEWRESICSLENELENSIAKFQVRINHIKEQFEQERHTANVQVAEYEELIKQYIIEDDEVSEKLVTFSIQRNILNRAILDKMLTSTWSMVKSWFHRLDEQKEIESLGYKIEKSKKEIDRIQLSINNYQQSINEVNLKIESNNKDYNLQYSELLKHITNLKQQKEHKIKLIENQINSMQNQQDGLIIELEKLSDGAIVGDGRSDFTQEVGDYHFLIGDKKFVILDLPGIEGKEEIVQSSIDRAVEKAHVIFYVSKKPTPPQKGDNENLGTIEKISRQLSKQSEVYFIYNKPVRNPRQLKKPLIDQDDENGLLVVDEVLSAAFNENYVSHRSLSAYPAFLALGNFYSGKYFKDRGKFTEKFEGATHILELSQILQFADWMTGQLVDNVKDKIAKSNYKKIKVTLDITVSEIGEIHTAFKNLEKTLQTNYKSTSNKLDDVGEVYSRNIINSRHQATTDLKNSVRKKIYEDIDKEISNEEFEKKMKIRVEEGIVEYANSLNEKIDRSGKEFTSSVVDILSTYQRYVNELVDKYANSINFTFDFKPQINIKKNINIKAIAIDTIANVISIVYGILNATNPIGWVVIGLSALTILFDVYKKFRAFIDKDFRKSQQRKSANENIDKVIENIENQLDEQLLGVRGEIIEGIAVIKEKLMQSVIQIETMSAIFLSAKNDMNQLSLKVVKEEGEQYGNN